MKFAALVAFALLAMAALATAQTKPVIPQQYSFAAEVCWAWLLRLLGVGDDLALRTVFQPLSFFAARGPFTHAVGIPNVSVDVSC